ncbi:MAG: hypothetical protein E6R09_10005 [Rhodocyclaceae bacterium]|nr:MAG: hypothetical protein E6R09_10005 [Rhodocyclaceae bacterium]
MPIKVHACTNTRLLYVALTRAKKRLFIANL